MAPRIAGGLAQLSIWGSGADASRPCNSRMVSFMVLAIAAASAARRRLLIDESGRSNWLIQAAERGPRPGSNPSASATLTGVSTCRRACPPKAGAQVQLLPAARRFGSPLCPPHFLVDPEQWTENHDAAQEHGHSDGREVVRWMVTARAVAHTNDINQSRPCLANCRSVSGS